MKDAAEIQLELRLLTHSKAPPELAAFNADVFDILAGVPPNQSLEIDRSGSSAGFCTSLLDNLAEATGNPAHMFEIVHISARSAEVGICCLSVITRIVASNHSPDDPMAVATDLKLQTASGNAKIITFDISKHVTAITLLTKREFFSSKEVRELRLLRDYEDNMDELKALVEYENSRKMDCEVVRKANRCYAGPKTKPSKDARSGFRGIFGDQRDFFAGLHQYGGRPMVAGDEKLKKAMEREFLTCTDSRIRNIITSNYGSHTLCFLFCWTHQAHRSRSKV